jgi:hypothetical protein
MPNGRCRIHGGKAGAPKGNKNNLKHGLYTADAIAHRRKVGALLRTARALAKSERPERSASRYGCSMGCRLDLNVRFPLDSDRKAEIAALLKTFTTAEVGLHAN